MIHDTDTTTDTDTDATFVEEREAELLNLLVAYFFCTDSVCVVLCLIII